MATYTVLYKSVMADGNVKLYIRITHERKHRYFDPGIIIRKKDFEYTDRGIGGRIKPSDPLSATLNRLLEKKIERARKIEYDMLLNDEIVTAERICDKLTIKDVDQTLQEYIISIAEREKSYNNRARLKNTASTLHKFMGVVRFKDVDRQMVKNYARWLDRHYKKSSVAQHLANLKAIINLAVTEEIFEWHRHPFVGTVISRSYQTEKIYLDEVELRKFADCRLIGDLALARDFWMAMYYAGGARPGDMLGMLTNCIQGDRLRYVMKKTAETNRNERMVDIPIMPELKEIFDRYKGKKYIFPFIDEDLTDTQVQIRKKNLSRTLSRQLKRISEIAGIKPVLPKMARKTVVYILELRKVDLLSSGDILNHSSATVTHQHYRARQESNIEAAFKQLSLN